MDAAAISNLVVWTGVRDEKTSMNHRRGNVQGGEFVPISLSSDYSSAILAYSSRDTAFL
jgi:hypothetical protein